MTHDCGSNGCGEIANERMRYFPGRFMSARDFTDEQDYFRTHRYLHNRLLHGWGVVRGLHVFAHPNPACRNDHVKLECGLAVDCCGREVIVPKTLVPPPLPWSARPADPAVRWYPLLCLEYAEDEAERVPVLYSERNCDAERREYSRVAETYALGWQWVRESDLPSYGWKIRGGGCPEPSLGPDGKPNPCADDDCYQDEPSTVSGCLETPCPPDFRVPLAWIDADGSAPITADQIVTLGRPTLEVPGQSLTHICGVNWTHGGVVTRSEFERTLQRLEIRFDRRLRKHRDEDANSGPRGINECTFVVQFGDGYDDLEYASFAKPPHVENDCVAVYEIDPRNQSRPFAYLENHTVFVTLKCDFVLDCHDVPVDGDHLAGILPSGDGIRGGTFESWFRVMPDFERDVPPPVTA
jgi:hypothetical protein